MSVSWTVDRRLGGLAGLLSTSVVFAGICSGLSATFRYASGLVVTFGMATCFLCILFLLTIHLVF